MEKQLLSVMMGIKSQVFTNARQPRYLPVSCNPHPSMFDVDFISCDPNTFIFLVPVTFFLFGFVETFYAHDYVVSKKVQFFLSVCRFFLFLSLLHQLGLPSTMLNRSAESSQPFLFMEENIQTFTINYDVRWGFWIYALPVKPENPTKCSVMTQGFSLPVRWTWAWKPPFEFSKLEVLGK